MMLAQENKDTLGMFLPPSFLAFYLAVAGIISLIIHSLTQNQKSKPQQP